MAHLVSELTQAWLEKARRAEADLNAAAQAPALFSADFIARREADYYKAMAEARRWHSQDTRAVR